MGVPRDARNEATELIATDPLFMGSPLSHITGFMYASIAGVVLGAKVCLQDIWNVPAAIDLIESEGCAWTVGATPFLQGLLEHPEPERLNSLRVFRCGGADVPPSLIRKAQARGIAVINAAPYGAGVLVGWTKSGTRPQFDVVTGVSTGASAGAFSFKSL